MTTVQPKQPRNLQNIPVLGIWYRAKALVPLTPLEQAILKLVGGFLLAGLAGGCTVVGQYLYTLNFAALNWQQVIYVFLIAATLATLRAAMQWETALTKSNPTSVTAVAAAAITPAVESVETTLTQQLAAAEMPSDAEAPGVQPVTAAAPEAPGVPLV